MSDLTSIAAFIAAIVAFTSAIFTYFSTRNNQRDLAHLEASLSKIEDLKRVVAPDTKTYGISQVR